MSVFFQHRIEIKWWWQARSLLLLQTASQLFVALVLRIFRIGQRRSTRQRIRDGTDARGSGFKSIFVAIFDVAVGALRQQPSETLQFNTIDRTITVIEEGNESGSFFSEYLARLEVTPGIYLNLESLSSSIPSPASCNLQAVQGTDNGNASTLDDEAGPLLLDDFDDYAGDEFEENLPLSPSLSISSTQTPPQESSTA